MKTKLAQVNQSVEKTLRIIEKLAHCENPVSLQVISDYVDMPASTVFRLINTLYVNGYVNQDPVTLHYSLSLKFTQIGELVNSHISIGGLANNLLIELSRKCKETSSIAIAQNNEAVYLNVINVPDNILRTAQQIGKHAPMHCDAIGKILLSQYSKTQLDEYIKEKGLPVLTPKTIISPDGLADEFAHIHEQGYAVDDEESELGVRSIAAPIRNYTGKIIAGISITGPAFHLTSEQLPILKDVVTETANKLSKRLAYDVSL